MPISQNLVLENSRVLLRALQTDDLQHLAPFTATEPDTWQFSIVPINGEAGMQQYIETALQDRERGYAFPFIVFDKQTGEYAGSTRYYDVQPANETLQLGYTWYGQRFRRTGLNRHCKFLLLRYAFEQLQVKRVEFRADARNLRSIEAMKAIGCVPEGILRSHLLMSNGGRRDSIVLSILSDEWADNVKAKLQKLIG